MVAKKKGLGRGLDSLIPRAEKVTASGLAEIPLEFIKRGKYQPRTHFSEESISELADSIREQGLMQPIVLRTLGPDQYEIIAGERRWRAAKQAGLDKIAAVIRNVDDESALAMSLIENIQREDLNPLEEARALQRLAEEFQFTHEEIAKSVGRSRSAVTNMLRLTQLAEPVSALLASGEIEMGHARALLTLARDGQIALARNVAENGLNVRQTEELVRNHGAVAQPPKEFVIDTDTRRLESNLGQQLGQPVQIRHSKKGQGKLIISYNSLDELDGILQKMGYEE